MIASLREKRHARPTNKSKYNSKTKTYLCRLTAINKSKDLFQAQLKEQTDLLSLLREYPDLCRGMNLQTILNKANFIKPRYFTIASSATMYPTDLHIAISLHQDKLPSGKVKDGATSAYLERLGKSEKQEKVRLFTKDSNFVMQKDP